MELQEYISVVHHFLINSRHFSIDLIVALLPGNSSETMFHL